MERILAKMPNGVIYTEKYSVEVDGVDKINYARECRKNYIKRMKSEDDFRKNIDNMMLKTTRLPSGFGIHLKTDNLYTIYDKHN
ncbi:hypothetical protein DY124_06220 [Apilactobacillus micheneri]|uniref:hypothetical protein n=1 Tax=Apilactobacillus micheneri TaxID=1899430 RepID=UPI00112824FF|nr:hypothetical protein [Apilactobacillus micheneri]TPR43169.1 hypothetical protein DY124_06220 [Apilactobacillus micheneri]TPR47257.1 hypothetical protein DY125_06715 [Apilactobacillus micheneri]